MIKKIPIFILTILFSSLAVLAQNTAQKEKNTVFKGQIIRSDTKAGVPKVEIYLLNKKKSDNQGSSPKTETDTDGNFIFENLQGGKYTISIRASFDREEDVPCQLLAGKLSEPNSKLIVMTENKKKIEQIFLDDFSIKEGKEIVKTFDLVCKSLFSK